MKNSHGAAEGMKFIYLKKYPKIAACWNKGKMKDFRR